MGDMSDVDVRLCANRGSRATAHQEFRIRQSSDQLVLVFPDDKEFGILNSHITNTLSGLIGESSIQLDALGDTLSIQETISSATKAKDAVVRFDINVYGSNKAKEDVGRRLSDSKVYLQRPDRQRPGSTYDNPHIIDFPDLQTLDNDHEPEENRGSASQSTMQSAEIFQNAIQEVYRSLHRGSNLQQLEGDIRFKTTLLPCVD